MLPDDRPKNNGADRPSRRRCRVGCLQGNIGADYTDDERELLVAVDRYKRKHQLVFLTCREMLEIIHNLGYRKPGSEAEDEIPHNLYQCGCHSVPARPSYQRGARVKPLCPIHYLPLVRP